MNIQPIKPKERQILVWNKIGIIRYDYHVCLQPTLTYAKYCKIEIRIQMQNNYATHKIQTERNTSNKYKWWKIHIILKLSITWLGQTRSPVFPTGQPPARLLKWLCPVQSKIFTKLYKTHSQGRIYIYLYACVVFFLVG